MKRQIDVPDNRSAPTPSAHFCWRHRPDAAYLAILAILARRRERAVLGSQADRTTCATDSLRRWTVTIGPNGPIRALGPIRAIRPHRKEDR
jgi:hypothetical protein